MRGKEHLLLRDGEQPHSAPATLVVSLWAWKVRDDRGRSALASDGRCVRGEGVMHEPFHDAVWTQQRLPAKGTSSPQSVVKSCTQRMRQAASAERLLAAFLFDAAVWTTWDGATGAALAGELPGNSGKERTLAARLHARSPHRRRLVRKGRNARDLFMEAPRSLVRLLTQSFPVGLQTVAQVSTLPRAVESMLHTKSMLAGTAPLRNGDTAEPASRSQCVLRAAFCDRLLVAQSAPHPTLLGRPSTLPPPFGASWLSLEWSPAEPLAPLAVSVMSAGVAWGRLWGDRN